MKASTTTFYHLLQQHPDVWLPPEKEPHFFTSDDYESDAAWEHYRGLFAQAPEEARVIGEASTRYSSLPRLGPTPQRIRERLGRPRLIYLVRDPVERIVSNYRHVCACRRYPPGTTLGEAMARDPILVTASLYEQQVRGYLSVFGADELLLLTTDELHRDPVACMRKVEEHLAIPPYNGWPDSLAVSNASQNLHISNAVQRMMPPELYRLVRTAVPHSLRRRLLAASPIQDQTVMIAARDRQTALSAVKDDLRLFRDRLGDRISSWPSVQMLGL
jgi:hypothetical protein